MIACELRAEASGEHSQEHRPDLRAMACRAKSRDALADHDAFCIIDADRLLEATDGVEGERAATAQLDSQEVIDSVESEVERVGCHCTGQSHVAART